MMGLTEMISVDTLLALALSWGIPGSGAPRTPEAVIPEDWYVGNACIQCHRQQGGRLAEIVDEEWAKSVHYTERVPCQDCHGGDATLTRDQFASDEEFKDASHLEFFPEFLFLRNRADVSPAVETGVSYACRECHRERIEKALGEPHTGLDRPACVWSRDGGVSMNRMRGIAYVCAKCHSRTAEKHLGSFHGSFGAPSCLFCHGEGSHAIPAVTIDIIDTRPREELGRCSPCHKPTTMNVVARVRETLEKTAELIETSAVQFEELKRLGYRNLALGEMHAHVDDIRTNLRQVLHGSNIREINELARSIKHVAKHTAYDYELVRVLHEARQRQTRIAVGAAGLLFVLAGMLVLYRRVFCRHADHATALPE